MSPPTGISGQATWRSQLTSLKLQYLFLTRGQWHLASSHGFRKSKQCEDCEDTRCYIFVSPCLKSDIWHSRHQRLMVRQNGKSLPSGALDLEPNPCLSPCLSLLSFAISPKFLIFWGSVSLPAQLGQSFSVNNKTQQECILKFKQMTERPKREKKRCVWKWNLCSATTGWRQGHKAARWAPWDGGRPTSRRDDSSAEKGLRAQSWCERASSADPLNKAACSQVWALKYSFAFLKKIYSCNIGQ